MLRDVIVVGSCASVIYAWLCAVVPPLLRSVRTIAARRASSAWAALALAAGGGVLWTIVPVTALFVMMMLSPGIGFALLRGSWLPGLVAGAACWMIHAAATRHVPRIGSDFETATALGLVALVRDDPETLARVEQLYRTNAAPDDAALPAHWALVGN